MLNSGFRGKRATDGTGAISVQNQSVQATFPVIKINSYSVTDGNYIAIDDTAVITDSTVVIYGNNFVTGMTVYINNSSVATTYLDPTRIAFTAPALSNGTYIIYMITPQGAAALLTPGIVYSGFPTWTTSSYNTSATTINIQLVAAGDAPLTYSLQNGSTLPTGITLTSTGVLTGTATSVTTDSVFYFTVIVDDAQLQSTQQSITLTFQFGDPYFKYTTLLLNGETTVTPFISDASTNSLPLVIQGDTKPTKFTPYSKGYYSNFFDGTGDWLTAPDNDALDLGSSNFTVEGWFYQTGNLSTGGGGTGLVTKWTDASNQRGWMFAVRNAASTVTFYYSTTGSDFPVVTFSSVTLTLNTWTHFAVVRSGSTLNLYKDGALAGTSAFTSTIYNSTSPLAVGAWFGGSAGVPDTGGGATLFQGYISNVRVVKGTAVYTTTFTPSTTPLTVIANTSLLTCQSNNLVDESTNAFTITKTGDVTVNPLTPFATPTTALYNTLYSTKFLASGYLTTPGSTALTFGTGDFTIELWVYPTVNARQDWVDFDNGSNRLLLYYNGTAISYYSTSGGGSSRITGSAMVLYTWQHLALVRISGSSKLYINGVQSGSTYADTINYPSQLLTIGKDSAGSTYVTGYISNLRIVKGLGVYTDTFTTPTSPLESTQASGTNIAAITGSNTSLLTCAAATFIDNSSYTSTITVVGGVQPITVSPFTMTTSTNTVTTLGSAYFDGTGDYLTIPNNVNLQFGTGDFTVECWIFPTAVGASTKGIIAKGTNTTGWELRIGGGTGDLEFSYTSTAVTNATVVTLNSWHHVALTRSGTSVKAFLDGVVVGTATTATDFSQVDDLKIGDSRPGSQDFSGYISNVRILKGTALYTSNFLSPQIPPTAVTNTQLLTLQYNGGATSTGIIDNSPFNTLLTKAGNTKQGSFSPYSVTGWSNYFDGTGDSLSITNNTALDLSTSTPNWTIEAWFYATVLGVQQIIVQKDGVSGTRQSQYVLMINVSNQIQLTLSPAAGAGGNQNFISVVTVATNTWYHVMAVRSGGNITVFLNGVIIVGPTALTITMGNNTGDLTIGFMTGAVNYFTGYISNLRILKGTALYTAAFTSPTSPLTPITNTSLLTCQSNRLIDNSPNNFAITKAGDVSVQAYSPFGSISEATPISYSNFFDGTGDYFTLPSNQIQFTMGTGDFTFECWIYITSLAATRTIYDTLNSADATGTGRFAIQVTTGGVIQVFTLAGTILTSGGTLVISTWYHIAYVKISNSGKLYLNGTQVNTTYTDNNNYVVGTTSRPVIGINGFDLSSNPMLGFITNLRVVKGTGVYTATFTPSTTPLTAITNTSLLTCQSTTMIDNSTNAFTITAAGNTVPRIFNSFGYTTQLTANYSPTTHGGSAFFDGTTDYLTTPASASNAMPGDFTVECWAYPTSIPASAGLVGINNTASSGLANFGIYLETSRNITFWVAGNATSYSSTNTPITIGAWNHIAFVRSGSTNTVYVNGISVLTNSATPNISGTPVITVGRLFGDNTGATFYGYMSDVRVTKRAVYTTPFLPPTQTVTNYSATYPSILLLNFNTSGIVDAHGSHVLETSGNAQLSTAVKKYGSASMYFDGTGDYLTIPTNPGFVFGTGDFTIEAWFYIVSGAAGAIFDTRSGSIGVTPLLFFSSSTLRYYMNGGELITSGTTLSAATWYHVALARSSGSSKMFLNGVQTGSTAADTNNFILTNTINIGRGNDGNNVLNGYIDELRITKGFARYTANFTVPSNMVTQ